MGIIIIPNQPIRFRNIAIPESCICMGQEFSQLINKDDQTQFQIKSTDQVINGDFTDNLDGWNVYVSISGIAITTNTSSPDICDGQVNITASGGTAPYTYSIDAGETFQSSNIFTGLCNENYSVIIKDSLGREGNVEFGLISNIVCGDYADSYLSDIDDIELSQINNCYLDDFD